MVVALRMLPEHDPSLLQVDVSPITRLPLESIVTCVGGVMRGLGGLSDACRRRTNQEVIMAWRCVRGPPFHPLIHCLV